jgi:hypothetical protein
MALTFPPHPNPEKPSSPQVSKFHYVTFILVLVCLSSLALAPRNLSRKLWNSKEPIVTEPIVMRNAAGKVVVDLRVDQVSGEPSLRLLSGDGRSVIEMGMLAGGRGTSIPEISISRDGKKRLSARSGPRPQPFVGYSGTTITTEINFHDDDAGYNMIQLAHESGKSEIRVQSGTRVTSGMVSHPNSAATIYGTPNDGPAGIVLRDAGGNVVWGQWSAD